MTGCFRVFPLPKRGYTWLISSDGKMVEIGGNLAPNMQNLVIHAVGIPEYAQSGALMSPDLRWGLSLPGGGSFLQLSPARRDR